MVLKALEEEEWVYRVGSGGMVWNEEKREVAHQGRKRR